MKKLPDGWIVKQFTECIEDEASSNKLKIPQNNFQERGKYPIIDQGAEYIAGYTDDSSKIYKGDLPIIIFGDHTRIFKFVDFPFALGADGTKILVPKKSILYPKYFYYFLNGLIVENHGYSRHYKFLKERQIVIPPLPTQKKIAALLEKAEKLREWRKEADGLTDRFLKSTFLEMFGDPVENPKGWERVQLERLIRDIRGGASLRPEDFQEKGFPVLHKGAIKSFGKIELDAKKKTSTDEDFAINNSQSLVDHKYLVVTLRDLVPTGPSIGLISKLTGSPYPKYILAQGAYGFLLNEDMVHPEYIVYLSNMHSFRKSLKKLTVGSTQIHIRTSLFFKNLKIPLPPLPLQQKFAHIVHQVEQIREHQTQSRQHIDNLSNALMQRAFRGELEV